MRLPFAGCKTCKPALRIVRCVTPVVFYLIDYQLLDSLFLNLC